MKQEPLAAGYLCLRGAFPRNFRLAQQHLSKPQGLGVLIEDISIDALMQELRNKYPIIEAAGGLVQIADTDQFLMILRHGRWDLPKGKLDSGENSETCALREVQEETGVRRLQLDHKICDTYHVYPAPTAEHLKVTHWYAMSSTSSPATELMPQVEEDIIEARWIDRSQIGDYLALTYETIKDVWTAFEKIHSDPTY